MVNTSEFLEKEIPKFHALTQKYDRLAYWKEQKRRCIEGMWSSGRWIPGELYYYVNFHTISFEDGIYRGMGRPFFRDLELQKAYVYAEACGFSGFEKDKKYTCNRQYGPEKDKAIKYGWITQEEVDKKEYVPAREYLTRSFMTDLGKPLYENEAKHIIDLECFARDTKVLMYNGSVKNIQDIKVGDVLMGPDSKPRHVKNTHSGTDDLYEVNSKRFGKFMCNSKHKIQLLERKRINGKYRDGIRLPGHYEESETNYSAEELFTKREQSSFRDRFYLYQGGASEFENPYECINPYFVGYWLSDGRSNTLSIKSVDSESVDNLNFGNKVINITKPADNRKAAYEIKWYKENNPDIYEEIKPMLYNKHIPLHFKTMARHDRMEMLAGIIDGDGCYDKKTNSFDVYCGLNEVLANDTAYIARSCGFYSNVTKRIREGYSDTWEVLISGEIHTIPTRYSRKQALPVDRRINVKRSSFQIKKAGRGEFFGIEVDGDNLFMLSNWLVVHNSRGGGKSYWASACIVHNFLFDGARDYDLYLEKRALGDPLKSESIVGAINAIYSNDLLAKVKVAMEYLPDSQTINTGRQDEIFPSPLSVGYFGSLAASRFIQANKSGSIMHHRTFGDNPLAANATRPNKVFLDEAGFINNIKPAWEAIEATQASAAFKRLTIHAMGTGGLTSGGAALYLQEMFYNPEAYGALAFDDVWEQKGKIGYFVPGQLTLNQFKKGDDKITDVELATKFLEEEREDAKNSGSATKYMGTVINKPMTPSEVFLRAEGVFFQVSELKQRLGDLEGRDSILNATYKFDLDLISNKVKPKTSKKQPIREFPLPKGSDMNACVEVFELPRKNGAGSIPAGRYIAGWDPVSSDGNENTERSLQSCYIFDMWTDRIVAEYTARTYLHDDYYEEVRKLLIFYNARCNYERNIRGPYSYFKNKDSLHLLVDTPEILQDKGISTSKPGVGNATLGTQTNQEITNWGLSLIRTWLGGDAYGEDSVKNVFKVCSPGLIKELISYNPDINVDRISALIMVMILREDKKKFTQISKDQSVNSKANDKLWGKAFGGNDRYVQRSINAVYGHYR